ncbi:GNAT family N-acetyltransferase [Lebetimonas sp. JH292]|uniref:GNAT family N-acetyltransferase n=1 Tax=Lebetimonas sp. JH292 TaxID=990068 RepID=UPI00046670B7|nr:GNAT family N-acetyltransferase [Lebetimonas sp. JH292]
MVIKFIKYQKINKSFISFFKDEIFNNREYEFLKKLINDTNKNKSTIYVLEIENKKVGLIGLTFDRVANSPVISIDYIFVAKSYRGKKIKKLSNKKISEILIYYAIELGKKIKDYVSVRYLALYPDMQNINLTKYYLSIFPNTFKLKENKEIWILLKI